MSAEPSEITTRAAMAADVPAISRLSARVFGPGRFVRTAYRVREGTPSVSPFCRIAETGGRIIAAIRMTAITIGGKHGALLLGPLAVDPDFANLGHGRRLIAESMEAARAAGIRLVLLVGDLPYYGRLGFVAVPNGQISLPGPVDTARLLACELVPGALADFAGLAAAPPATAS
ncbi:MAG: N-acetyltransferase [Hyphomicrobiaceae bacterium]|nr:N-acetyltransferase [Hyphomicrobiaceae bacterium]